MQNHGTSTGTGGDSPQGPAEAPPDTALDAPVCIQQVIDQVTELSTLPHIAIRMMQVAGDPGVGAADVTAIVQTDPTLTARVLRAVNCAAAGLRFKVGDLQRAIAMLGFERVRSLAVTASVSDIFKHESEIGPYKRSGLWRHMVAVAVVSRMIAARCRMSSFNEVFLAGLLHDIGIILEDQYCHGPFTRVMRSLEPDPSAAPDPTTGAKAQIIPLCQAERDAMKLDHCVLGFRIGRLWKFPDQTLDVIRRHHTPIGYRGQHADTLACVDVANYLCSMRDMSSVGVNLVDRPYWSATRLNLSRDDLQVLAEDMDAELEQNEALFNL
jgi:putative nucleotidyltransferase with HDIG domain